MNTPKYLFICLFLILFGLLPVVAAGVEVGAEAPDFKLKNLQGQDVSLSEFKGQVVLLKLATTWCPSCKQLSGKIEQVGAALKEQDVVFLDVYVQDSPAMVEKYLADRDYSMTYYALLDDGQAYAAYNIFAIPRLLIVDAGQVVRYDNVGGNLTAEEIVSMTRRFGAQPE
jgi:thiol-disulfide isomerase/thioredoxin